MFMLSVADFSVHDVIYTRVVFPLIFRKFMVFVQDFFLSDITCYSCENKKNTSPLAPKKWEHAIFWFKGGWGFLE